jgi:hypothetical protein
MHEWINWSVLRNSRCLNFLSLQQKRNCKTLFATFIVPVKLKLAAAGHSSPPLVQTKDTLVHLHNFDKLQQIDSQQQIVRFNPV